MVSYDVWAKVTKMEGASCTEIQLPGQCAGSFSEDRPLGWDPVAAGNRAGDGMARFVSEEKAAGTPTVIAI